MRWIKLFEGYLDEPKYWEIDRYPSEIDKDEKRTLKVQKFLEDNCDSEWDITPILYMTEVTLNSLSRDIDLWITADDDDYYYVRYDDQTKPPYGYFYKCDQWEGLVQFLKDKNII